jgi:hypothetical protein
MGIFPLLYQSYDIRFSVIKSSLKPAQNPSSKKAQKQPCKKTALKIFIAKVPFL